MHHRPWSAGLLAPSGNRPACLAERVSSALRISSTRSGPAPVAVATARTASFSARRRDLGGERGGRLGAGQPGGGGLGPVAADVSRPGGELTATFAGVD